MPASSTSKSGQRESNSVNATRDCIRAAAAPRQWWAPWLKVRMLRGHGARRRVRRRPARNWRSSRLPEPYTSNTRRPAGIVVSPMVTSRVTVRANACAGVVSPQEFVDGVRGSVEVVDEQTPLVGPLVQ